MKESILIALQVYFMGFAISMFIALMIKGILFTIRKFSK